MQLEKKVINSDKLQALAPIYSYFCIHWLDDNYNKKVLTSKCKHTKNPKTTWKNEGKFDYI